MRRKKTRRSRGALDKLSRAAVGYGRLGVTTAVGATASGMAIGRLAAVNPAAATAMAPTMSAYGDIAGFGSIAAVPIGAGAVLGEVKKLNKKRRR